MFFTLTFGATQWKEKRFKFLELTGYIARDFPQRLET
jgi:hypothetical protein